MDRIELGKAAKQKREALCFSQEDLAYKAGVSSAVIGKIEKGRNVNDAGLSKVLLALGLKDLLSIFRGEAVIQGYEHLSLSELRTVVQCCTDIVRESKDREEINEVAAYRKVAKAKILEKLRIYFKGEDVEN